jgi:hypothetical protein
MRETVAEFARLTVALFLLNSYCIGAPASPKPPATAPGETLADGSLLLKVDRGRIHGFRMKLDPKPTPTIIFWIDPKEYIEWPKVAAKGKYDVEVTYSCAPNAGGEFAVTAAANKAVAHTQNTKDWKTFRTQKLGPLTVLNNQTSISLRCTGNINHLLMNVRELKLIPLPVKK